MRTYLDCIPCLLTQALRAARLATDDEAKIKKVLDEVGDLIKEIPLESPPPVAARRVYHIVKEVSGVSDPYRRLKNRDTRMALELYPALKEKIKRSPDPLLAAIRLAIAGNKMDFGVYQDMDFEAELDRILQQDLAVSDYDRFKEHLTAAHEILYIGDNAGESVLDRILIEELGKPVTYVVRSAPVINDVTHVDAVNAGLDAVTTLLESGTDAPGVFMELCSPEFRMKFHESSLIISKGQGNFEALSASAAPLFFLLIAKCPVMARDLGVEMGDLVLKGPGKGVNG